MREKLRENIFESEEEFMGVLEVISEGWNEPNYHSEFKGIAFNIGSPNARRRAQEHNLIKKSDLESAKENYYKLKIDADSNFNGLSPSVTIYITELEAENKRLKEKIC